MAALIDALGFTPGNAQWMDLGLCKGADADRWHSYDQDDIAYAKGVCRACPVITPCMQWGLVNREYSGIWGGLTERDRQRLLKAPQATEVECSAGHPLTAENVQSDGRCRTCAAARAAAHRARTAGISRVPCDRCGRDIGLDRAGRIIRHLDMSTRTTCTGSWKTPVEVKA